MAPVQVQIKPLVNGAAIVSITATAVSPQAKPVAHAGHTEASTGPYAVRIKCTDESLRSIVVSIEGPGTGESISGNHAVAVDVPVAPSMLDAQPAVTGSQIAASSVSGEDLISTASSIVSSIVSAASSLIMPRIEIPGSADWFFSRADADNNGNIDVAELRAVFDEQGVSGVDIDELFEKCSSNGVISRSAWCGAFYTHMTDLAASNDEMQRAGQTDVAPARLRRRKTKSTILNGVPVFVLPQASAAGDDSESDAMKTPDFWRERRGTSGDGELFDKSSILPGTLSTSGKLSSEAPRTHERLHLHAYAAHLNEGTWAAVSDDQHLFVPRDGKALVVELDGRCTFYIRADGSTIVFQPHPHDGAPMVTRTGDVVPGKSFRDGSGTALFSRGAEKVVATVSPSIESQVVQEQVPAAIAPSALEAPPYDSVEMPDATTAPDSTTTMVQAEFSCKVGHKAHAMKPLVMRSACELTSSKVGDVKSGTAVYVLALDHERNGTQRVHIALGDAAKTRGWVTALAKDGKSENLTSLGVALAPDVTSEFLLDGTETASLPVSSMIPNRSSASADAASPPTLAMGKMKAGKVSTAPAESHRGGKTSARGASKAGKGGAAASNPLDSNRGGAKTSSSTRPAPGQRAVAKASDKVGKDKGKEKSTRVEKTVKERVPEEVMSSLMPASELFGQAAGKLADAAELKSFADQGGQNLVQRLGNCMIDRAMTVTDLMQLIDANNDGNISKGEWRTGLRSTFQIKAENREIEEVFDMIDTDGGGTLDTAELKVGLQKLVQAAEEGRKEDESRRDQARRHQQEAVVLTQAGKAMEAADMEELRLKRLRKPMDVRLGDIIAQRTKNGGKLKDNFVQWDPTISTQVPAGKGVSKQQFKQVALSYLEGDTHAMVFSNASLALVRNHVAQPDAEMASAIEAMEDEELVKTEIDACYDALNEELMAVSKKASSAGPVKLFAAPAVKMMMEAAQRRKEIDEQLLSSLNELRQEAGRQQHARRIAIEAERQHQEYLDAMAKEELTKMAQAQAARAKAKAEAEAAEQAEFEKRVQEKRRTSLSLLEGSGAPGSPLPPGGSFKLKRSQTMPLPIPTAT